MTNFLPQRIILGITGGIAAYKSAELVRLFQRHGTEIQVVMTQAAQEFITPVTLQALSGRPVMIDMWDQRIDNGMPHIELSRQANAILIAPATANFIAKLVHGSADDLLSTLCLARTCPLIIAPAMNKQMWENPATQRNIQQAHKDGIEILGPDIGEQACGETGYGRMLEPETLIEEVNAYFTPKLLQGKQLLITAGPTMEMMDPVRGITNISSGKMGYALAKVAANMGAKVTLISGPTALMPPHHVQIVPANNATTMHHEVMAHIHQQDIFISVAAVADYTPSEVASQKIKKNEDTLTLKLKKNIDILSSVAALPKPPFCVGFAAESERVIEYASQKRLQKKIPLIVANNIRTAMGKDENEVTLIDDHGQYPLPQAPKETIAFQILSHISQQITPRP